jgi:hypothetical protein
MTPSETPIKAIVDYWTPHEDECGLAIDWAEAHERCWRCGYKSNLEKCHIIPDSLWGPDVPSNFVLLCKRCHREAPNIKDPRFMWIWMRATCVPFYDLYWTFRGFLEFETMFGRMPFSGPDFKHIDVKEVVEVHLKDMLDEAIIHFGEGRLNPATIASIIAKIEESITGKNIDGSRKYCITDRLSRIIADLGLDDE